MKTKNIKILKLNKEMVSNFETEKTKGGHDPDPDHTCLCPSFSICPPGVYCY